MADNRRETIISSISELKCEEGDLFVKNLSEGEKIITDFVEAYVSVQNSIVVASIFITSEFKVLMFGYQIANNQKEIGLAYYYDFSDYKIDEQVQTKEDFGKFLQKKIYKISYNNLSDLRNHMIKLLINKTKVVPRVYAKAKAEVKKQEKVIIEKPSLLKKMFG